MKQFFRVIVAAIALGAFSSIFSMIKIDETNYKSWDLKLTDLYRYFAWNERVDVPEKMLLESFATYDPASADSYNQFMQRHKTAEDSFFENLSSSKLFKNTISIRKAYSSLEMFTELPIEKSIQEEVALLRHYYLSNMKQKVCWASSERISKRTSQSRLCDLLRKHREQRGSSRATSTTGAVGISQSSSTSASSSDSPLTPPSLISQKFTSLKKHFVNNLGYILAAAAITSYGLVIFKLFKEAQFVRNEENWSAHEDYMPTETFFMRPMQETTDELLRAIMLRYKPSENNVGLAVEQFMADTKAEIKRLKNFLAWHEWLDYLMLDAIFPDQPEMVHLAKVKLLKLEYMQHVLQTPPGERK